MEIRDIVELINKHKENEIPLDVSNEDVKLAYKYSNDANTNGNIYEKEDNLNYGYLGTLRLRDIKTTYKFSNKERAQIVETAKKMPTKLLQVAYVYKYFVTNFNINLDYLKSFEVYYKSNRNILEKSEEEIKQYYKDDKEYLHPFKEVTIDNKKYVASTRVDLYETRTSIEGIISHEFANILESLNNGLKPNMYCCNKNGINLIIQSINIGNYENPQYIIVMPTADILNKQLNGTIVFENFGIDNKTAEERFNMVNPIPTENKKIDSELKAETFNELNKNDFNM